MGKDENPVFTINRAKKVMSEESITVEPGPPPRIDNKQGLSILDRLAELETQVKEQRLDTDNQRLDIEKLYKDKMLLRAIDLEKFIAPGLHNAAARFERNLNVHGADIATDISVTEYLEKNNKARLENSLLGLKRRYKLSRDEYRSLKIPAAPDSVTFAINMRSDMEHFRAYQGLPKKKNIIETCNSIIQYWKDHVAHPKVIPYPSEIIDERVEQISKWQCEKRKNYPHHYPRHKIPTWPWRKVSHRHLSMMMR